MVNGRLDFVDACQDPTHEFDGRLVIDGKLSPLCAIRLWMPIDCHDDVRIEVNPSSELMHDQAVVDKRVDVLQSGLLSELGSGPGLEVVGEGIHVRSRRLKPNLKINGVGIVIDHVARLRFRHQFHFDATDTKLNSKYWAQISFRLSDLEYGRPSTFSTENFSGARQVEISDVRTLQFLHLSQVLNFELQTHWSWVSGSHGRLVAGNTPVLVLKEAGTFKVDDQAVVEQVARDVCLLLTLAARHLVTPHVLSMSNSDCLVEQWNYPLNRQRSTTEEQAAGPLVDQNELEAFFLSASTHWAVLTDGQRDAVRLAIFSINPVVLASVEGAFLRKFTALEGVMKAWFPTHKTLADKVQAMLTKFPLGVSGLWPITAPGNAGLNAIRNHIAHGNGTNKAQQEALLVASDHLQVLIEHMLMSILGFQQKTTARDWLLSRVKHQATNLVLLASSFK